MARRFKPFKPYSPPPIPSGSYDPNLDAQRGAAQRGYGDLRQDVETANRRATIDYGLARDQGQLGWRQNQEDYERNTGMLQRSFQQLAGAQESQAAQAGVLGGGALLQAASKRAANQQLQQSAMDIQHDREYKASQTGLGQLLMGFQRGQTDTGQQLERAGRENTQFGLDVESQKAFQAGQAGYTPPPQPRGQFTNRNGVQRRRVVRGGVEYIVAPDGTVVHRRKVR